MHYAVFSVADTIYVMYYGVFSEVDDSKGYWYIVNEKYYQYIVSILYYWEDTWQLLLLPRQSPSFYDISCVMGKMCTRCLRERR